MAKAARRPRKTAARPAVPRLPKELKLAIAAAADKKAEDVTLLDLRKASAFTDFFLICTGTNLRQVQAIADAIETAARDAGAKPSLIEGYERGQWILLDYFDFIVHVFTPATRDFYGLERLWGDAKQIKISEGTSSRT
jgi:ribosome-associated protein